MRLAYAKIVGFIQSIPIIPGNAGFVFFGVTR
jgi:hypothetical protein